MKRFACWAGIILLLISVGCGSREVRRTITDLMDAEITFPEGLQTKVLDRDTTLNTSFPEPYKLVAYLNSTQCDGCRLKDLLSWKHFIQQIDSLHVEDSVRFVFVFHPKDTTELYDKLKLYDFDLPVWVDAKGEFSQVNALPDNLLFHVFLLNRDNRVMLVGSPIGNPKMWKLYENTIARLKTGGDLVLKAK